MQRQGFTPYRKKKNCYNVYYDKRRRQYIQINAIQRRINFITISLVPKLRQTKFKPQQIDANQGGHISYSATEA
jgi:flagellar basal body rod protein FlgC